MATVVELSTVEGFILDDPIAGVLDNVEYTLGGNSFADITSSLITASVSRGKNRDLDRYSSGVASIVLNNEDRKFDPLYTAGPLYNQLVPRREIRITTDGERVFTGTVDDYNLDYVPKPRSKAEIAASDDLSLLSRQLLSGFNPSSQLTGARVTAVLDDANVLWPTDRRDVDTGQSALGTGIFDGNALEYLQQVDGSEQGALFVGKSGDLVFRDRLDFTPTSTSVVEFADDGTGIPYQRVQVNYGIELLYNNVTVTSAAGTAIANNQRSRSAHGVSSYEIETLVDSQAQLDNLADFLVSKYSDPEYRISGFAINLDSISTGQKASVLGLELGDVVKITFTPNSIGDPIVQFGQVIQLAHEIDQTRHDLVLGLASVDWTFLVLDDAVFGTMDSNNALAF